MVGNTWSWVNRGFAVRVGPTAPHGSRVTATLTYQAPADPAPHAFVLKVDIPVLRPRAPRRSRSPARPRPAAYSC
ncbi:hypothetical protein AB0K43_19310 [Kitasatospora sp. NPDC049258]|uniref:hypothetical protein n=1 Tax=Kitasatospora sp. NPDC049258 TaxID=3155394 RepID=UPI00341634A0